MHKRACDHEGEIDEEERKTREIGENLAMLVPQTIKEAGSYQGFERKVVDLYLMGGRVGRVNHSSKFMRGMVAAMYDLSCRRIKRWLHAIDPLLDGQTSLVLCRGRQGYGTTYNRTSDRHLSL
eukprot:scaffold225824_cov18-Prasinocladus_malaysianus.AAC.2